MCFAHKNIYRPEHGVFTSRLIFLNLTKYISVLGNFGPVVNIKKQLNIITMTTQVKDIIENTKNIYMSESSLDSLMDFERVIDELDTYVFKNWDRGELVEGPVYDKYFVTCTFMWPYKLMPDPRGGERLLDYKCEITYRKDTLEYPVDVKDPDDFQPGTKTPKLAKKPVWLVTIVMPKQLMRDIHQGSLDLEAENINIEDIEQAYEVGLDDDMYQNPDQQMASTEPAVAAPGAAMPPLPAAGAPIV